MQPNYPKKVSLAYLPTPIAKMRHLSNYLGGPNLFIKRDDLTGLATGGNKTRKLEYLLADALAQGCDHLVTTGSSQSNHCRQTAAAAAKLELGCSLVRSGTEPKQKLGNLLLDDLLGAFTYWVADRAGRAPKMAEVMEQQRTLGHKPYQIPLGGSNVAGATGYVAAMGELAKQLDEMELNVDFIVIGSSSGGTQAGKVLGTAVY